jgi:hypothetical protein
MDMVAHNAKIVDLEAELLFGPPDGVEKEGLHGVAMEDHLFPVCPGGNVIGGAGLKFSISPHTNVHGEGLENALVDLEFFSKILNYFKLCPRLFPEAAAAGNCDGKLCPPAIPGSRDSGGLWLRALSPTVPQLFPEIAGAGLQALSPNPAIPNSKNVQIPDSY